MLIYFTLLAIVVIISSHAEKLRGSTASRYFLGIIYIAMVLVAGLRDRSVGTDTGSYVNAFNRIQTFSDIQRGVAQGEEYGLWVLGCFVHLVSDQYAVFLLAIALIVVGCYHYAIVKYSSAWSISYFVFFTMGFYTFFFNGARQGIACAISALAIGPLLQRNLKIYVLYVFMALLFHTSALIMLPVYFILNTHNSIKKNLFIILVGIGLTAFYQRVVEFGSQFVERYEAYAVISKGGGYFMMALSFSLCTFFYLFKKHVHTERERYNLYFTMFLFGTMISVVSAILAVNPSGFARFSIYFNISAVFLWPIVFKNILNRSARILTGYLFSVCYLMLFYLTTERFSNLVPYNFNPEIFTFLSFGG